MDLYLLIVFSVSSCLYSEAEINLNKYIIYIIFISKIKYIIILIPKYNIKLLIKNINNYNYYYFNIIYYYSFSFSFFLFPSLSVLPLCIFLIFLYYISIFILISIFNSF